MSTLNQKLFTWINGIITYKSTLFFSKFVEINSLFHFHQMTNSNDKLQFLIFVRGMNTMIISFSNVHKKETISPEKRERVKKNIFYIFLPSSIQYDRTFPYPTISTEALQSYTQLYKLNIEQINNRSFSSNEPQEYVTLRGRQEQTETTRTSSTPRYTPTYTSTPTSTPTSTIPSSSYPLLQSLGLPVELSTIKDKKTIRRLLSEIVSLHTSNEQELTYLHPRNNSRGTLINIPHALTQNSFNNQIQKNDWIKHILLLITNNKTTETRPEEAATWICKYFFRNFESTFAQVAKKKGWIKIKKLSAVQAAAMWSEANVPANSAEIILRHIRHAFGYPVVVPRSHISAIGKITKSVTPVFGKYDHHNKEAGVRDSIKKKAELVNYWTADLCKMIQSDYERLIKSDLHKRKGNRLGRKKYHKFGYPSPLVDSSETTVDVVVGGDHGTGAFRLLGKLNYLSSKQRKSSKRIEHGSRVFHFGNIKCKKDTRDIVSLLSPAVNDIIKKLEGGMLVGISDKNRHEIKCVFVPKISTNLQTQVIDNTLF